MEIETMNRIMLFILLPFCLFFSMNVFASQAITSSLDAQTLMKSGHKVTSKPMTGCMGATQYYKFKHTLDVNQFMFYMATLKFDVESTLPGILEVHEHESDVFKDTFNKED